MLSFVVVFFHVFSYTDKFAILHLSTAVLFCVIISVSITLPPRLRQHRRDTRTPVFVKGVSVKERWVSARRHGRPLAWHDEKTVVFGENQLSMGADRTRFRR